MTRSNWAKNLINIDIGKKEIKKSGMSITLGTKYYRNYGTMKPLKFNVWAVLAYIWLV